ncbi:DUF742 domain-containing protein [Nucisporomicrobium flavum]|jgi:Protein of unknown function (DUF742)|uniref:DUF742 domain-containing protein n=1 Tax=Nucisporomicrobium flavum TaxID=2785915 RepID=UPI0018F29EA2|nr:DUF742 domain-containing protein [Nucisporomicrobium flavum]
MTFPADPDDPDHPAATGVRPFLRATGPGVRYEPAPAPPPGPAPGEPPGEHTTSLRPFVITSGRVAAVDPAIGLETQVSAHPGALSARLSPEQRAIVHLCGEPLSVAEISARLRLHFGVTRILVGDLRAAGHLDVHVLENDFPDPETIMRVIRGLRSIS